jgi:hypothetical protein
MITVKVKGDGVVPPAGFIRYWLWSLFGNEQDGPIGDTGWNPQRTNTAWVRLKWWCRNPLHNFTFYTLGLVNKDLVCKCWPSLNVFNPAGGWLFMLNRAEGGWMRYPFVSYIGPIKFYIGWRLGNRFGVKLTANSKK